MTEQQCLSLIDELNNNQGEFYKINIDNILDMFLITSNSLYKSPKDSEYPNEYQKIFMIKNNQEYVGCFFPIMNFSKIEDFIFYIKKDYRGKIEYIKSFDRFVFSAYLLNCDTFKISFKNEKIKEKFSKIKILNKLQNIKGRKIIIKRKEIEDSINNDYFYTKKLYDQLITEYKKLFSELSSKLLNKYSLISILNDPWEGITRINDSFFNYYYIENTQILKDKHKRLTELHFLLKQIKY